MHVGADGKTIVSNDVPNDDADVLFRPNAVQSPWAAKPEDAPPKTKITDAFAPGFSGSAYYEREVPDNFSGPADDRLMNSLISRYSLEGNTNGEPNGHFYLTKEGTRAVSKEVINTHLGFEGAKGDAFLNKHFNGLW